MKLIMKNANLFEPDLKSKLYSTFASPMNELEKDVVYDLALYFNESLIFDEMSLEAFKIPDDALLRYLRGKALSAKEKLYQLLSYQVGVVAAFFQEHGILLYLCNITGVPAIEMDSLEINLEAKKEEKEEEAENTTGRNLSRKKQKSKITRVTSVMPSLSGFAKSLNHYWENYEKQKVKKLTDAFGNADNYNKYIKLLGTDTLYELYNGFEEEYGAIYSFVADNEKLRKKFLEIVKEKAGSTENSVLAKQTMPSKDSRWMLIYEIPVYRKTKTDRGARKYVGHARLITDGRMIKIVYKPNNKAYKMPEETFRDRFCSVDKIGDTNKLLNSIRELIEEVDKECLKYNYSLEVEIVDHALAFMDIKNMLKKIRKENL